MAVKPEELVVEFFDHPNPIIYSHHPGNIGFCKVVIPEDDGSFSKKSPQMGLPSFLLEVSSSGTRDLRNLWHSWDESWPRGLWNRKHRQDLVDTLNKSVTFFFDAPTISPDKFPEDLNDPRFFKLDVREGPLIHWLKGPFFETILGLRDSFIVFSLIIPAKPTRMQLEELGLVYSPR